MVIKGVEYTIGDDELEIPDDEKGDTKIDKEGRLLGGMCFPVVIAACTTILPTRQERLDWYMVDGSLQQAANTRQSHSTASPGPTQNSDTPSPSMLLVPAGTATLLPSCGDVHRCSRLLVMWRSSRC